MNLDRRMKLARDENFTRKKAEIAARLKPVCQGWCDEEFDTLITRITLIDIKYNARGMLPSTSIISEKDS